MATVTSTTTSTSNPLDTKKHIVLLGDSIFDNNTYVRHHSTKNKDVITHLRDKIAQKHLNWEATLLAVDGHTISGVTKSQIAKIPSDTTDIFVSVGGNNALMQKSVLYQPATIVGEALFALSHLRDNFHREYQEMVRKLDTELQHLPSQPTITLCTIYNPRYDDPKELKAAQIGLSALNDIIIQEAINHGLPVIDLKTIFNEYADYANPIEPSHQGGEKIAETIMKVLMHHDFIKKTTAIFV